MGTFISTFKNTCHWFLAIISIIIISIPLNLFVHHQNFQHYFDTVLFPHGWLSMLPLFFALVLIWLFIFTIIFSITWFSTHLTV